MPFHKGGILEWSLAISRAGPKQQQYSSAGIVLFIWWQIWKGQNKRIVEN
jgi:hypothetical protein